MTDDDRVIERMARKVDGIYCSPDGANDFPMAKRAARAAYAVAKREIERGLLEEMREPDIDMLVAGTETWLCEAAVEDRARTCWQAMLETFATTRKGE